MMQNGAHSNNLVIFSQHNNVKKTHIEFTDIFLAQTFAISCTAYKLQAQYIAESQTITICLL